MGTGKQAWQGQPATDHSMCEKQDKNNQKNRTSRRRKENTEKLREMKDTKANKINVNLLEEGKEKKRRQCITGRGDRQHKLSGTEQKREERHKM